MQALRAFSVLLFGRCCVSCGALRLQRGLRPVLCVRSFEPAASERMAKNCDAEGERGKRGGQTRGSANGSLKKAGRGY